MTKTTTISFYKIYFCVLLAIMIKSANGQTISELNDIKETINKIDRAQRLESNFEKDLIRQKEFKKLLEGVKVKPARFLQEKEENCVKIKKVSVKGVSVYRESTVNSAILPYTKKCLGKTAINNILRALTNLYIKGGYITSRAYISRNPVKDGILNIVVIEGKVEDIQIQNDRKTKLHNIFPGVKNNILNIRDVEQGLDQLNRMQSVTAKSDIKPGSKSGKSIIVINQKKTTFIKPDISIENSGAEKTGKYLVNFGLNQESVLGFNDILGINLKLNTDYERKVKVNRNFSVKYDIPYGYWNFMVGASKAKSLFVVQPKLGDGTTNIKQKIQTEKWDVFSSLQKVMYRDEKSKLTGSIELHAKNKRSYINKRITPILTARRYYASLKGAYMTVLPDRSTLSLDLGVYRGIGARNDEDFQATGDKYFTKLTFDTSWQKAIKFLSIDSLLRVSLASQFSNDDLFSEDMFQIGGMGSVQGYKDNTLAYKSGINIRTKVTFLGLRKKLPFNTVPYIGFDFGMIFDPRIEASQRMMTSLSAGFRAQINDNLELALDYGKALTYPKHFKSAEQSLNLKLKAKF